MVLRRRLYEETVMVVGKKGMERERCGCKNYYKGTVD